MQEICMYYIQYAAEAKGWDRIKIKNILLSHSKKLNQTKTKQTGMVQLISWSIRKKKHPLNLNWKDFVEESILNKHTEQ